MARSPDREITRFPKRNHRDGDVRRREVDEAEPPATDRVFRITDDERQQIAKALRYIDDARRALQEQQNPDNREIIRELRASADEIYDVLNELEQIDHEN